MLKLRDLALRSDFEVGPLAVSPSRRRIKGPAAEVAVEPLIMQVLLLLLDADGRVVTRDELFDQCWGGVIVGDDSLNRAIGKLRRIGSQVAPGLFEIETIPRTGYRLTGPILDSLDTNPIHGRSKASGISRRTMIVSAGAAFAAVGGLRLWSVRSNDERRLKHLLEESVEALEYGDPARDPTPPLKQAVALRPASAEAQGLLSYALLQRAEASLQMETDADVQTAERAADAALQLDPQQPEARLARIMLQKSVLDMQTTEMRLRQILANAPNDIFAMRALWNVLQCGGRSREALTLVERSVELRPLAAANNYPRAQLLWIVGRPAEADRVIDAAMSYWPAHRYVRFARFTIFAFTGRPGAALHMLDSPNTTPQNFSSASVALWRKSLPALQDLSGQAREAARRANLEAVQADPKLTGQAALTLSALGEVDAAFKVANNLLLFQNGGASQSGAVRKGSPSKSTAWRFAPWLFTPPCAAMRADPRFGQLCDGIGLTDYWNARGVKPDYLA
jgi:DNA-binding winged helix-turn-helix (wHTH) protein/tetratricopeptide (TPR) repeat protein